MSANTDAIRFSRRALLDLFEEDETRLDALIAQILTNVSAWWLNYNKIVLVIESDKEMVEAAGGTHNEDVFVHYWRREDGGRFSLFNNVTPPTWNGGTFAHNFVFGQRVCNGFLFNKDNY